MIGRKLSFVDIPEENGTIVYYEKGAEIPFAAERIVCVSDVPEGASRMNFASITADHVLTTIRGTATLHLDNVKGQRTYRLRRKNEGVYVPKMVWMRVTDFSKDAILMVLSNKTRMQSPVIDDYGEFVRIKEEKLRRKAVVR